MKSRELRYFAKLGGDGKPVQGVLERRLKNPEHTGKSGKWFEVFPPNCCTASDVVAVITGTTSSIYNAVTTLSTGSKVIGKLETHYDAPTTLATFVNDLNTALPGFGTFTVDGAGTGVTYGTTVLTPSVAISFIAPKSVARTGVTTSIASYTLNAKIGSIQIFPTKQVTAACANLTAFVAELNTSFPSLGTFILTGSNITVAPKHNDNLVVTIVTS